MAGSLNRATLIGNLGKDPEVRQTQGGMRIVNFSVATTESWKDKNSGEKKDRTHWHNIVIFSEPLGKVAEQYLKNGSKVYLEGSIETRKYEGKDGTDRYTTEIVLRPFNSQMVLLGDGGSNRPPPNEDYQSGGSSGSTTSSSSRMSDVIDDDIPF